MYGHKYEGIMLNSPEMLNHFFMFGPTHSTKGVAMIKTFKVGHYIYIFEVKRKELC